MSFELSIKELAARWTNSGGSHSDDLLGDLTDILKAELDWEPTEYNLYLMDRENYDELLRVWFGKYSEHLLTLDPSFEMGEFLRDTEGWNEYQKSGKLTYQMTNLARGFYTESMLNSEFGK